MTPWPGSLASLLPWLGFTLNADGQLLLGGEASPYSGMTASDSSASKASLYTSGRIGWVGQYPNFALLNRDVAFIFNEIVFSADQAGKDSTNYIRLSVDKVWQKSGADSGAHYFNEIRVFSFESGNYKLKERFNLDQGVGMLDPFLLSVPNGQWPTVAPAPSLQN